MLHAWQLYTAEQPRDFSTKVLIRCIGGYDAQPSIGLETFFRETCHPSYKATRLVTRLLSDLRNPSFEDTHRYQIASVVTILVKCGVFYNDFEASASDYISILTLISQRTLCTEDDASRNLAHASMNSIWYCPRLSFLPPRETHG